MLSRYFLAFFVCFVPVVTSSWAALAAVDCAAGVSRDDEGDRMLFEDDQKEKERRAKMEQSRKLTIEEELQKEEEKKATNALLDELTKDDWKSIMLDLSDGKVQHRLLFSCKVFRFYNFYYEADNADPQTIGGNLFDFCDELNAVLISCGFAQLYVRHPFDCLLLWCANSFDPIDALYCVIRN